MFARPIVVPAVSLLLLQACVGEGAETERQEQAAMVAPSNPTCEDLGLGTFEIKVDPPQSGTYAIDAENSVTVVIEDLMVSWSSTIAMDAVLVKGGTDAHVYTYDQEASEDAGLHSPINPNNDTPYGVSHVNFCYDYELAVAKTAETSVDRTYAWAISKSAASDSLLLAANDSQPMGYQVQVTQTSSSDSNWAIGGTIAIRNPSPYVAPLLSVTEIIDESITAEVDCAGAEFPYQLAAFDELHCRYSANLPDGSDRIGVTTAQTDEYEVGSGFATSVISFAAPTIHSIDSCIAVTDTLAGDLGSVCLGDSGLFEYDIELGPYAECATQHEVVNIASFEGSGSSGSASAVVTVEVAACEEGCTLTQGYWKNHSEYGPAPYDDTWAMLKNGAATLFFLSGHSWLEVFDSRPRGNAYYVLAHQYMAAQLNRLSGANPSAVMTELASATELLESYTPDTLPKSARATAIELAETLDQYNNGMIGPGHCDK